MEIISRAAWGAVKPRSVTKVARSKRRRFDVHYSAGPATQTPRDIQRFHMEDRGWSDVGYNFLVDVDGRVYEGRGWDVLGAHIANHNTEGIGVCMIGRNGDVTPAAMRAIRQLADEADRIMGRKLKRDGHRDLAATECPGDRLHAWVHAGMPVDGIPAPPKPAPPAGRPAPGPALPFPLPRGYYFGRDNGRDSSVSGTYRRRFKGRTDREWIQEFGKQLARRGWSIGKGKTYLRGDGNNGIFGPEYEALTRAFQADQGLAVDGRAGIDTWTAAYHNPVT